MKTTLFLSLLVVLSLAPLMAQQPAEPHFTPAISTPQPVVKAGSDAPLDIVMTITAKDGFTIAAPLGEKRYHFDVQVLDGSNHPVPMAPYGKEMNTPIEAGSVFGAPLAAGKSLREQLMLNREYELNPPGSYTIQVQRYDPGSSVGVKSNIIKLTVNP